MMISKLKLTNIKLDKGGYTKSLDEALQVQMRQAARAWLRAVVIRVPVFTGTARGSLKPLGTFLRVAIPIDPVATRKGMGPDVGESQGHFAFNKRGNTYTFRFNTSVAHYIYNEFNDAREDGIHLTHEPIPWHSMEAGKDAFNAYMATSLKSRIPKIGKFLIKSETKV